MLVISHPTKPASLPQPNGPALTADVIALPANDTVHQKNEDLQGQIDAPIGRTKRVMGRSTSMFHPSTRELRSSRSCTPATSVCSSDSSLKREVLSTPASTVRSDSYNASNCAKSARSTALKPEPFIEVEVDSPAWSCGKAANRLPESTLSEDPAAIHYDVPVDIPIPPFGRRSVNADRDLARVWEAVAGARRITVICGAGISVSSPANIPDFRSTAGLFRKLKEKHPNAGLTSGKDLFDASLFTSASTSSIFYSMIAELKAMADAASPTTFHHLLKRLDLEGRLQRVYTQNIDGLEQRAGLTFGLGQTGDSRATLRALGKRKRGLQKEQTGRTQGFARSKSDSVLLFTQKQEAERRLEEEETEKIPMFPRTIPLHGSLSTLTCAVCSHKIYLSLASSGPQRQTCPRELSPDAPDQALAAMDLLSQGESVSCVKCEDYERVRSVAGLRSRGVGIMKVDVVLYNGQNDGAEQVGECVQRDILGLRDPNETSVPESSAEKMARERKERKEREVEARGKIALTLAPILEAKTADDAFANAFDDGEEGGGDKSETARVGVDVMQWTSSTDKRQTKAPRLKPLPPDLLIVAGTSLKVPGTKRIVREFAKACHARDRRVYPSSDESEEEDCAKRISKKKESSKARNEDGEEVKEEEEDDEGDSEEEDEEVDPNAPIRTILLNYDFPVPPSQWKGVFDVWVQGDVQQSALGLWEASKFPSQDSLNGFNMREDENHELTSAKLSWLDLHTTLEEERKASKKGSGSKRTLSQQAKGNAALVTPPSSQQTPKGNTPKKTTPVKERTTPATKGEGKKPNTKTSTFNDVKKASFASQKSIKKAGEGVASIKKAGDGVAKNTKAKASTKKEAGIEKFMQGTKSSSAKPASKKSL
ncbi:hypothetical protein CBS101457_002807 [Exobasidium rhododendri]|nr:hypothetical protein CBS101457_002807 [Exobasidium rhododendri]